MKKAKEFTPAERKRLHAQLDAILDSSPAEYALDDEHRFTETLFFIIDGFYRKMKEHQSRPKRKGGAR